MIELKLGRLYLGEIKECEETKYTLTIYPLYHPIEEFRLTGHTEVKDTLGYLAERWIITTSICLTIGWQRLEPVICEDWSPGFCPECRSSLKMQGVFFTKYVCIHPGCSWESKLS